MSDILIVSTVLFGIGVFGLLSRRELIFMLLSLEVMFNAAAFAFVGTACQLGQAEGQVMFLIIASVAAAEMGVGLALVIASGRS